MKKKLLFLILCGLLFLHINAFCADEPGLEKNFSLDEVLTEENKLFDSFEDVCFEDIPEDIDTDLTLRQKLALLFAFIKLKTGMVKDSIVEHFKRNKNLYLWICGILIGTVITIELVHVLVSLIYCSIYDTF